MHNLITNQINSVIDLQLNLIELRYNNFVLFLMNFWVFVMSKRLIYVRLLFRSNDDWIRSITSHTHTHTLEIHRKDHANWNHLDHIIKIFEMQTTAYPMIVCREANLLYIQSKQAQSSAHKMYIACNCRNYNSTCIKSMRTVSGSVRIC